MNVAISIFCACFLISNTVLGADCKVSDSDIAPDYSGACLNGYAHGLGVAKGKDTYSGNFLHGDKHGKGKYMWADGRIYEGDFRGDKIEGKGEWVSPKGNRFIGHWKDGRPVGLGKMIFANDEGYAEGEFVGTKLEGFGVRVVKRDTVKIDSGALGKYQGENWVQRGIFRDSVLIFECQTDDVKSCKNKKMAYDKRKAIESAAAQAKWERDRPAREAKELMSNICRAQVNTCIASCPMDRVYTGIPDSLCRSRCESVLCN